MEILFSVENFEESNGNYREINSPRTLEACLRSGLDPAELYPKSRNQFTSKSLTKEMIDIKFDAFEKKRLEKIHVVKTERNHIVMYAERKQITLNNSLLNGTASPQHEEEKGMGMQYLGILLRRLSLL